MRSKSARADDSPEIYQNRGNMITLQVKADGKCTIGIDLEYLRGPPSFGRLQPEFPNKSGSLQPVHDVKHRLIRQTGYASDFDP
jgi:hypothetical protein